ncbi:MAG: two-component regulator propeller domain-containing protein [Flavobacteriales bacterium]
MSKIRDIVVLLFLANHLSAQVFPSKYYGLKEGLPNTYVSQFFQDTLGNMWFATLGGGISKFDGSGFKNYGIEKGLKVDLVRCITADKDGRIFVGTFGDGVYTLVNDSLVSVAAESIPKEIYAIKGDKFGNIWVGAESGIYKIDKNQKVKNYTTKLGLPKGPVTHISEDNNGNVWFGYDEYIGVFKLDLLKAEIVERYDSTSGLTSGRILSSFHDSEGGTWITAHDGLYKINREKKTAKKIINPDIPEYYLFEIVEPKPGLLLIGSQEDGVVFYDTHTNKVLKKVGRANGIKTQTVFRLFKDDENNIWVSTWGEGISRLIFSGWSQIEEKKGFTSKFVNSMFVTGNEIYCATNGGILKITPEGVSAVFPELIQNDISAVLVSEELIFCAKEKSLQVIDIQKKTVTIRQEEYLKSVKAMTKAKDGTIYFASWNNGISYYKNGQFAKVSDSLASLIKYYYTAYTSTNGTIWFGSWQGGVVYFDGLHWRTISTEQGLPSNKVMAITEDAVGNMIFGTNGGGIAILSGDKIKTINSKNGLPSNSVFSLVCDKKNNLWIGLQGGVSRYNMTTNHIKNFDYSFGFDGDCLLGAMIMHNEAIWVGTNNYLWRFTNDDIIENKRSLKAIIKNIRVNNLLIGRSNNTFSHKENKFTFEFYSSQMLENEKVKFQFRLLNIDEEFSPLTIQKEVSFLELQPGIYTFELRACIDYDCSKNSAFFSFEIYPPLWKTWWFRALSVLFVIVIFYTFYQWRTATLRKRQIELEKTVRKRTAEVVAEKKEVERQKHLLEEKNQEITDSINYAKRIQEAILPSRYSLAENLNNGFVLFKPKDIVSGDFYWLEKVGDVTFFAAADCTGHGVPGAMVSVVCSNALSKALLEENIAEPGKLLDRARELVVERFAKSNEDVKDGMDISLCALQGNTLSWAGANNPLWIIADENRTDPSGFKNLTGLSAANGKTLYEIKSNKQPIGKVDNPQPFTTHTIELKQGDTLYIFTDGYQDQFGGDKGKKFKASKLKELLLSIQHKTMEEQKGFLDQAFEDWRGNLEQIDDVCIIGVRI